MAMVLINVLSHSLSLVMAELIKTQEMDISQLEAIHITGLSITENGTTFVETSSYNPRTNILTISVPAHNAYGQTDFLLDGKLGQTVMKSNGSCMLSNHGDLNVREMAEKLQQMNQLTPDENLFSTDYLIKVRRSRVGFKERAKLTKETNEFCKQEGIINTEDKSVNKREFEALAGGEMVILYKDEESISNEDQCWIKEACTNPGPNACGYGWPNPTGGGISAHQLSATVVCVECCVETTPGCCRKMFPDFCSCQDISHKTVLMDCILGNDTHEIYYKDPSGSVVRQTMQFNAFNPEGNSRALRFHVHAHDNFQDMTMMMHAAASGYWHHATLKNNMLLQFGKRCHILDLPSHVFPMDIGVNFLETESGNFILNQEDQIISTNTLIVTGAVDLQTLHPDIQKLCQGFQVVKSEMVPANQSYADVSTFKLSPVRDITPVGMQMTSCCTKQVVSSITGACIQWTNPVTGTAIHVHLVVTDDAETDLTCCNSNGNAGCSPLYPACCECNCPCADITSAQIFRECLSRPLVLRKPITQDSIANNDLGALHASNLIRAMGNLKGANGGSLGYVANFHGDAPGPCGAFSCCPHGSSMKFLPWHRLYSVQMDTELRTQSTGVTSSTAAQPFTPATLPYWDWTTNSAGTGPMTALPDLVSSPTIVDPTTLTVMTNPYFEGFIPGTGGSTVRNPLTILFNNPTFLSRVLASLSEPTFNQFSNQLVDPHNDIHWMTGGTGGSMSGTTYAAYDPIFYLHHNMIDCVWAVFQYLTPGIDPLPATQALLENPFSNAVENPQEITARNYIVANTLDYENNLCYTYGLTGNPFLRSLDINSNGIVFGGMNLAQIRDRVNKVGDTEHYYGGFFIQSFDTSYRITFNICHYQAGQSVRCFPGGGLTVFGGRGERAYVNDIVTKVDITDKLDEKFLTVSEINSFTIEIENVETADGKEIAKQALFQPVNVLRYTKQSANAGVYGTRDLFTVNFGLENKNPPQMSILEGTRVKLVQTEKSSILAQFYEANNREAYINCDRTDSKLLTSDFEEPSLGLHFYFLGSDQCADITRVLFNVYNAPRNDVAT
eukprot:GFUD01010778.1.p1 GENE.GFUD01010778.1~~GFUD01010778.1.p1  ORF type:complete len:1132 (+),score=216.75 GFUD01010778.1:194-3397(+)